MAKKNGIKVIVKPATDNAYKEGYVKINGKVIPFDVTVILEERDIKAIQRIKEPKRTGNRAIDVHQIMNQMQITQEKANKIARMNKDIENAEIKFVPKYFVQIL